MNHMKEVAKLLGVEIGEEFRVKLPDYQKHSTCCFVIKEDGVFTKKSSVLSDNTLVCLLTGHYEIVKLSFKPKESEYYYYIDLQGNVKRSRWYADETDRLRFLIGNCFRTEEEAEAHKEEILEKFKEVDNE